MHAHRLRLEDALHEDLGGVWRGGDAVNGLLVLVRDVQHREHVLPLMHVVRLFVLGGGGGGGAGVVFFIFILFM